MKKSIIAAALLLSCGALSAKTLAVKRPAPVKPATTKRDLQTADTKRDLQTADTKRDLQTADTKRDLQTAD